MIRKIAYNYPKAFKGKYGQVRDRVILEASWLGNFEPYNKMKVSTYVYDMMMDNQQEQIAVEYDLQPIEVNVLDIKRTLCEKIMSLVRFSYAKDPITDLKNKIRHLYDLHKLLKIDEVNTFFESDDFENMLVSVAKDDINSFRNENEWLEKHPKEAIIFNNSLVFGG